MKLTLKEPATGGLLYLHISNPELGRDFFKERNESILTIAWNRGTSQSVMVDGISCTFPANTILPLVVNQTFQFEDASSVTAWQFNRQFYCIVDHDREVSCAGFLFYHSQELMFLQPSAKETRSLELMLEVFQEEFENHDTIQAEMLRMMLKRFIIKCTRMAKDQYLNPEPDQQEYDLLRKFNLLVENHYRTKHQVSDYAELLNKSPKTLSNLFALYNHKTPLQIIHERIIVEARRLFLYTDKSSKEIAYELGFEDPAHFSKFFKKQTGAAPSEFREKAFQLS
jgi:AraC family transcriptional regulator, transcriptional activator of pobA